MSAIRHLTSIAGTIALILFSVPAILCSWIISLISEPLKRLSLKHFFELLSELLLLAIKLKSWPLPLLLVAHILDFIGRKLTPQESFPNPESNARGAASAMPSRPTDAATPTSANCPVVNPSKFTPDKIAQILQEAEQEPIKQVATRHGVNQLRILSWQKKRGAFPSSDRERIEELERENSILKKILKARGYELEAMRELASKWCDIHDH
jgi:transposase-like protein